MDGVERVRRWVKSHGLNWRIHKLEDEVKTVAQAASVMKVPPHRIVKTLILVYGEKTIACIVPGDKRLNMKRVIEIIGGRPRFAKPSEVIERTGYSIGGVPPSPLPRDVIIIVDRSVLDSERVYGGGGDEYNLLEFNPRELVNLTNAIIDDISY